MAATAEAEESDDPYHYNDDDDDDDLQAALALSLHGGESQKSSNACAAVVTSGSHYHYGEKPPPTTTTTTPPPSTGHRSPLPYSYNSAHDDGNFDRKASLLQKRDDDDDDGHCFIFDCRSFQKLMWIDDDTSSSTTTGSTTTTTTIDDKQRWICECLQLRELQLLKHGNNHPHSSSGGENENIESDIHIDAVAASVNNEKTIADRVSADDAGNNSMMSNRQTPLEMFTGFNLSSEQVVPPLPTTTHPSQPIWCLTQTHGGPCGVLAAVQAEMIRILLFGRRDPVKLLKDGVGGFDSGIGCRDDSDVMGGGGEGRRRRRRCHRQLSDTLYYPFEIAESSSSATTVSSPITEREVHDSMAMAIGMILARAALAPCTSTAADAASSSPLQTNASRPAAAAAVRLVLPTAITSHDSHPTTTTLMEMTITTPSPPPSSSSSSSSPATINTNLLQELLFAPPMGKSTANYLMVHTIIVDGSTTNDNKSVANGNDNENNDPELPDTKRRRNTCMDSGSKDEIVDGRGEEDTISFDKNDKTLFTSATSTTATTSTTTTTTTTTTTPTSLLTALAISVANFLISEWGQLSNRDNEVKRIIDGSAECSPANETSSSLLSSPLEYFQGPGGVMYLVMSLVSTRSIDRIRAGEFVLFVECDHQ